MAVRPRYYDGKVAVAREVGVRPMSHELIIIRRRGTAVVARWPASELVVLGDTEHERRRR
jgi:metallophosphoesterase superfamily enzyme